MSEEIKKSKRGKVIGVIVAAIVLAVLFTWKPPNRDVPDALIGEWRTTDAMYADRTLEISPVSISFTTGEGTVSTGTIEKIQKVQDGARTLYTFEYNVDGTRNVVSFYLEPGKPKGSVIRFKNQPKTVWTKDENS